MGCILRLLKARLNAPRRSSKSFQRNNPGTSHASGARLGHRISRVPGLGAGLSSFHERVDQVRTSIAGRLHSALHGGFDLLAALHLFALDVVRAGDADEIDIRITKVSQHVLLYFGLASSL